MRVGKIMHDDTFSTFIKPEKRIPEEITAISGIGASTVACATRVGGALAAYSRFVGNESETCLVAHNGRKSDFRFLNITMSV